MPSRRFRTLEDAPVGSHRVLVRVDFNVPMEQGRVADDTRLNAALATIAELRQRGARVILISHLGRPEGQPVASMSLEPLAQPLSALVGAPVAFATDCIGPRAIQAVDELGDGDLLLLENLRFHPGEETNDPTFVRALASLGDLYVNDAFSASHRAHASTEGLARRLPAYAGRALEGELLALEQALGSPERPIIGLVGGAKISTKIDLLNNLVGKLQYLAIAGAMANTFLYAQGHDIGASRCEKERSDTALAILATARTAGCRVLLPTDVVVAEAAEPGVASRVVDLSHIRRNEAIFDLGPASLQQIIDALEASKTLIWNGPIGVFEVPPFDEGTLRIARRAAELTTSGKLITVAGGGDTAAALNRAGLAQALTFVSTAGGAFLEWMQGKTLPGIAALEWR